jgi:hypothetical protein
MPIVFVLRRETRLWIVWFACAVGLIAILDLTRSTLQLRMIRYSLAAAPAFYALLATAIPRGRWRYAPVAIAIAYALVRLPTAYLPPWKTDYRTPVEIVAPRIQPGDALVLASRDLDVIRVSYTAFQHYAMRSMPATVATLTKPADPDMLRELRRSNRLWIVWATDQDQVTDWLPGVKIEQAGRLSPTESIIEATWAGPKTRPAITE